MFHFLGQWLIAFLIFFKNFPSLGWTPVDIGPRFFDEIASLISNSKVTSLPAMVELDNMFHVQICCAIFCHTSCKIG